jgi:hypothetical protein
LIFRSGTADPDDPFKAHAAGSTIQVGADLAMLEGRDEDAIGSTQQPREVGLAHAQWKPPQVVAVERQDVKGDAVATPGSFRRFMFPFPFFNASSSAGTKGGALSRITIVPSRRTSTHSAPDCFAARIARAMSACAFLAVRRVMALDISLGNSTNLLQTRKLGEKEMLRSTFDALRPIKRASKMKEGFRLVD